MSYVYVVKLPLPQLPLLTEFQTYDTCIQILEKLESRTYRWESNPYRHNSSVMLCQLSYTKPLEAIF